MPIYRVEVRSIGYLLADDLEQAIRQAQHYGSDIVNDDVFSGAEVDGEVKRLSDLEEGWDGDCIPYGDGVKDRVLRDFLPD
jgi:hypothetical protein